MNVIAYIPDVTAYIVGAIDTKTGQLVGFDIFSEPSPTITGHRYLFVLHEAEADSYEHARMRALEDFWTTIWFEWARPFALGDVMDAGVSRPWEKPK